MQHQAALDAARDARAEAADLRSELSAARDHLANASRRIQKLERDNESLRRIESNVTGFYRSVVSSDGRPPPVPTPLLGGPAVPFMHSPLTSAPPPASPSRLPTGAAGASAFGAAAVGGGGGGGGGGGDSADADARSGGVSVGFPPINSAAGHNPRDIIARTARFLQRRDDGSGGGGGGGGGQPYRGEMTQSRSMPSMPVPPTGDDLVDDPFYVPPTALQTQFRHAAAAADPAHTRAQAVRAIEAADEQLSEHGHGRHHAAAGRGAVPLHHGGFAPHGAGGGGVGGAVAVGFVGGGVSSAAPMSVGGGGRALGGGLAFVDGGGGGGAAFGVQQQRQPSAHRHRDKADRSERSDRHDDGGRHGRRDRDRESGHRDERRHGSYDTPSAGGVDLDELVRGTTPSRRVVSAGSESHRPPTSGSTSPALNAKASSARRKAKGSHSDSSRREK